MSRIEFEAHKQGASEPIAFYITDKLALYRAYNPEPFPPWNTVGSWAYFWRGTLSGIYSKQVTSKMIDKNVANSREFQNYVLDAIGNY